MRFRKQDITELVESMPLDLSAFKVFAEGFDPLEKPNAARWAVVICDNEQRFVASYHASKGAAMCQVMTLRRWITELAEATGFATTESISPEKTLSLARLTKLSGKQKGRIVQK